MFFCQIYCNKRCPISRFWNLDKEENYMLQLPERDEKDEARDLDLAPCNPFKGPRKQPDIPVLIPAY